MLCRDLNDGIHAVSQPLTILRASLGSPDAAGQSAEDLRKLVRQSSREVERLCVLFSYLQQFVNTASIEAEVAIQALPGLLNHALEGVDLLFADAGVVLTYRQTEVPIPYVLVDSSRLEQAMCGVLLAALAQSERGSEVIVVSSLDGNFVTISVGTAMVPAGTIATETKLTMALAAANLRSQGANMTWSDRPLAAHITLPVADTSISA
jgi:signal transduction histidine kinase